MAQGLGYHRSNSPQEGPCRRTFWVLYFMEKTSCFATGKTSVCYPSLTVIPALILRFHVPGVG